jgi:UDP-GlcNAc:undecaprenyl-phosphate GlcNAc-1-phosphate transferase
MAGIVAATLGTLLAPLVQRLAARVRFVDLPDRHHKQHRKAVPLGGGLLISLSTAAGLVSIVLISPVVRMLIARDATLIRGLILASVTLIVVGVIDDWRGMRGLHKLFGQIVAALLLTSQGLEIRQLELLGWTIDLGVLAVPFTVFWLLGAINALNLLDGIDGLAGSVGLVTSLVLACVAIISGQALGALIAVALAGGCAAFLNANLPPAKMFLGDTGSMFLGLALGALTAVCCSNGPGLLSLAPAVAILAIPIMDSSVAIVRRRLTGRSIYMTDRGHLHHCLMQTLESHPAVLVVVATACLASGAGAALSVFMKNDVTAIISTVSVMTLLVVMRLFGHVECSLLLGKLAVFPVRLSRMKDSTARGSKARKVAVRLQGERQWNLLWESLTEWAEKLQLLRIDLDVNSPAMKESFHANWCQPSTRELHECWRMELPLFVEGLAVGRLQVSGERQQADGSICQAVDHLIDLLEPFEKAFAALAVSPGGRRGEWSAEQLQIARVSSNQHRRAEENGLEPSLPIAQPEIVGLIR